MTTTAGNTTTYKFTLGRAGAISANFRTTIGGTTLTGQEAPSLSWENTSMAGPKFTAPSLPAANIATTQSLFPFNTTTPSGPYVVYAGKCAAAKGTAPTSASVTPGATTTLTGTTGAVAMPGMNVNVTYDGANVKPSHIRLTDSCGQTWQPDISTASTLPANGWLDKPRAAVRHLLDLRRLQVHDRDDQLQLPQGDDHQSRQYELHDRQREHRPDPDHLPDGVLLMAAAATLARIRSEQSGFTLVELLVVLLVSMVVVIALFTFQDVVLRQSTRVFAEVDATQRARNTVESIENQLHSACMAENVVPIRDGSTGTSLTFVSKYGSAASLTPVKHTIAWTGATTQTLTDSSYAVTGGSSPNWTFSSTPSSTRTLLDHVHRSASTPVFRYYKYGIAADALGQPIPRRGREPVHDPARRDRRPCRAGSTTSTGGNVAANTIPYNSASDRSRLAVPLTTAPDAARGPAVTITMEVGAGGKLGDNTTIADTPVTVSRTRSSCASPRSPARATCRRCRHAHDLRTGAAAAEDGFTMIVALIVLTVSTLMIAAAFVAANGDIGNTQRDLDGKRAYYAARAGIGELPLQGQQEHRAVAELPDAGDDPGSGRGEQRQVLLRPGARERREYVQHHQSGRDDDRLRDRQLPDEVHRARSPSTAGGDGGDPDDRRQLPPRLAARLPLVLGLRDPRPEHVRRPGQPPGLRGVPARRPAVELRRDQLDHRRQDQRADVHAGPVLDLRLADLRPARRDGQRAHRGARAADRAGDDPDLGLQQQRDRQRRPDRERAVHHRAARQLATAHLRTQDGKVYSGATDITLNGNTATVRVRGGAAQTVNLVNDPIIYVTSGTCSASYSPYFSQSANVYDKTSTCGNVYVSGSYSTPVTIAAANDIIIDGSVTTNLTGPAVTGMVANNFIRDHARGHDPFGHHPGPVRVGRQRPQPEPDQPADRRCGAGAQPLVHRRQLRLRRADRRHAARAAA